MIRFVTEYRKDGKPYGAEVDALDFEHAQAICDERGFGETVLGTLYAAVAANGFSHAKADAMAKAFAESGEEEPPGPESFGRDAITPDDATAGGGE